MHTTRITRATLAAATCILPTQHSCKHKHQESSTTFSAPNSASWEFLEVLPENVGCVRESNRKTTGGAEASFDGVRKYEIKAGNSRDYPVIVAGVYSVQPSKWEFYGHVARKWKSITAQVFSYSLLNDLIYTAIILCGFPMSDTVELHRAKYQVNSPSLTLENYNF